MLVSVGHSARKASVNVRRGPGYWRLLLVSVPVGVASGLAGVGLTLLLHAIQHLAFGYSESSFLVGVEHASSLRRVVALGVGGLVVGLGWWLQRRVSRANVSVTHALTEPDPHLPVWTSTTDAMLQIGGVGVGGSLGREGAPRQVGAALASFISRHCGFDADQRRILIAAGAGAGLAAVYNVPIGGAVFAIETLLAGRRLSALAPAAITSVIATMIAWPFLGHRWTYQLPPVQVGGSILAGAVVVGVIGGLAGVVFRAAMTRARTGAPTGWRAILTVTIAFTVLGAAAIRYPQLLGNGKGPAELALTGTLGAALAAWLVVLKPLGTALCLRSGAIGGLLTPAFATGALLGAVLSHASGAGHHPTEYALLGAASVLAVAQRAPFSALALTWEFTHVRLGFLVPLAVAVLAAAAAEGAVLATWHRTGPRSRPRPRSGPRGLPVL